MVFVDGKEVLFSMDEIKQKALKVAEESLIVTVFSSEVNGWVVEFITDTYRDADKFFESCSDACRVFYGQNGNIRHAK